MSCFLCWNNSGFVVEVWAIYVVWRSINIHFHLSWRFMSSVTWCSIVGWVSSSWTADHEGGGTAVLQGVSKCYCAVQRNIQKTWIPSNSTVTHSLVESLHFPFSKSSVLVRVILWISPIGYAFNNKFCILSAQCIYVLCVDLRTNSGYFPIQH
jgi:hypothetical protein